MEFEIVTKTKIVIDYFYNLDPEIQQHITEYFNTNKISEIKTEVSNLAFTLVPPTITTTQNQVKLYYTPKLKIYILFDKTTNEYIFQDIRTTNWKNLFDRINNPISTKQKLEILFKKLDPILFDENNKIKTSMFSREHHLYANSDYYFDEKYIGNHQYKFIIYDGGLGQGFYHTIYFNIETDKYTYEPSSTEFTPYINFSTPNWNKMCQYIIDKWKSVHN